MRQAFSIIRTYIELCKINISLLSSFSAAAGFVLSALQVKIQIIPVITGVFVLACGACALNQYQDRDIDARMSRTRGRPVPSGRIKPFYALTFSILFILSGFILLSLTASPLVPGLGILAVLWYNGLYTFLKRKTAFAVIPGAIIGAIPVAIGWVAGGGAVSDTRLLLVCFFFFMWQVPHFWLLMAGHGNEYREAGMPSLTGIFTSAQLSRIIFIWILSTSVSALLISAYGIIQSSLTNSLLISLSLLMTLCGIKFLKGKIASTNALFGGINIYMCVVLLIFFIDVLLL